MTDTPNLGLKTYVGTDPASLLTGYNASMDTLDSVIKQAQDDIDALQDSGTRHVVTKTLTTNNYGNVELGLDTVSAIVLYTRVVGSSNYNLIPFVNTNK